MQTTNLNSAAACPAGSQSEIGPQNIMPPNLQTRTHVVTGVMCHHLGRSPQTARVWAMAETYPPELRPRRVMGRLAWPVAGIRAVLGVCL